MSTEKLKPAREQGRSAPNQIVPAPSVKPVTPPLFRKIDWLTFGVTTVLVFILGTGPVPYPDDFLWYGFPGTEGVSRWVNSNYQLVSAPTFPNVGYQYFIWLRK